MFSVTPLDPTKFFGCELGAQTQFDTKNDRYIVNGSHEANKLQDMLDGFIRKFVLCTECDNPETDLVNVCLGLRCHWWFFFLFVFLLETNVQTMSSVCHCCSMSIPRNKPSALPVRPVETVACWTLDTNCAHSSSKTHQVRGSVV